MAEEYQIADEGWEPRPFPPVPGHAALARHLGAQLVEDGFDLAASQRMVGESLVFRTLIRSPLQLTTEAMMSLQPQPRYTPEEYLARERKAEYRSEYFAGEIFAMSGASRQHNLIVANVVAALHGQFRNRPCEVYASDMRVKVSPTGLYTYPDVVALCGEPQFDDEQKDTLINPTVLIEVLSSSTEAYDRGDKFGHYRKLASLTEYVLISQERPHLEHYVRQPDNQWLLSEASSLQDTVRLPSINCALVLVEVYDKVEVGG